MKTKSGLDAVIKHTDEHNHYGVVEGKAYAKWNKETGVCVDPCGNSAFDLMIEQKPKYQLPDPTSRHYKFAKHCASIGYPDIEIGSNRTDHWMATKSPDFNDLLDYRIAGDPHHELRREWIDSDFTLPIEFNPLSDGSWILQDNPTWSKHSKYRKAEQKPLWHDYIEQGYEVALNFGDEDCIAFWNSSDLIEDALKCDNLNPLTTSDGKFLIGFRDGHLHILPVERGEFNRSSEEILAIKNLSETLLFRIVTGK